MTVYNSVPFGLDLPWIWVFVILYIAVYGRSCVVYSFGRCLLLPASRQIKKIDKVLKSDNFKKAERMVNNWGPPVVSLCFLTIGFQTAVLLSSGIGRMPLRRFLPALAVGAIFWALIYSTIGFVGLQLLKKLWLQSPALLIAGLVAIAVGVAIYSFWQKRSSKSDLALS